jgi:predicted MFS family arabinose efflux permease
MLVGAFALFTYSKQRWPEVTNYATDFISSAFTICGIGFFILFYLVCPFLDGFREARDLKLDLNRRNNCREEKVSNRAGNE